MALASRSTPQPEASITLATDAATLESLAPALNGLAVAAADANPFFEPLFLILSLQLFCPAGFAACLSGGLERPLGLVPFVRTRLAAGLKALSSFVFPRSPHGYLWSFRILGADGCQGERASSPAASCRSKHPVPQEIEAGPAVHLAFDRLQPADLPLHWRGAPGRRQRGPHCSKVAPQAAGQAPQRRRSRCIEPAVQPIGLPLADHGPELPGQRDDPGQHRRAVDQGGNEPALGDAELLAICHHQPGGTAAGRHPPGCRRSQRQLVGCPEWPQPIPDHAGLASEAEGADLAPELGGVAAALGPASAEMVGMKVSGAPPARIPSAYDPARSRATTSTP